MWFANFDRRLAKPQRALGRIAQSVEAVRPAFQAFQKARAKYDDERCGQGNRISNEEEKPKALEKHAVQARVPPAVGNACEHSFVGGPQAIQGVDRARKERNAGEPVDAIHRALHIARLVKALQKRAPGHLPPPRAAPIMSHIGRNTPSARTSTKAPMRTRRIGSAFAASPSTSSATSRSYMSAISLMRAFISPVSSPTATICSVSASKTPAPTAVRSTLSPRSMPSRMPRMRAPSQAFSTTLAASESVCTIGTPLLPASAKLRENLASAAL